MGPISRSTVLVGSEHDGGWEAIQNRYPGAMKPPDGRNADSRERRWPDAPWAAVDAVGGWGRTSSYAAQSRGTTVVSGSQCALIGICTAKLTVKGPVHNAIA